MKWKTTKSNRFHHGWTINASRALIHFVAHCLYVCARVWMMSGNGRRSKKGEKTSASKINKSKRYVWNCGRCNVTATGYKKWNCNFHNMNAICYGRITIISCSASCWNCCGFYNGIASSIADGGNEDDARRRRPLQEKKQKMINLFTRMIQCITFHIYWHPFNAIGCGVDSLGASFSSFLRTASPFDCLRSYFTLQLFVKVLTIEALWLQW